MNCGLPGGRSWRWAVVLLLGASLSANAYLLSTLKENEELNVNQTISRYYLEGLLKAYGNDLSFATVKSKLEKVSTYKVHVVSIRELPCMENADYDSKALAIGATRIFFKKNKYAGSQVVGLTRMCGSSGEF